MKNFLIILFIAGIIGFAINFGFGGQDTKGLSKESKAVVKLMKENKTNSAYKAINALSNEDKLSLAKYFEANSEKFAPVYYVYFADTILEQGNDPEKAIFWYMYGSYRSVQDILMCVDKRNRQNIYFLSDYVPKTINYTRTKYRYVDLNFQNKIKQQMYDLDDKQTERVSPKWACYFGKDADSSKPEILPESEFQRIKKEARMMFN